MGMQFKLTIEFTGESLQEIDDGLMQAAGARLTSRIQQPAQIATQAPVAQPRPSQSVSFTGTKQTKTRGRPPLPDGAKGKYERKPSHVVEPALIEEPQTTPVDDARMALSRLNDHLGIEAVEEALRFFGASKIAELSNSALPEFVSYCENLLK